MTAARKRRVIGIDLGTTNTVAATSAGHGAPGSPNVHVVPLLQYVDSSETETLPQLPSSLYHSLAEESFTQNNPNGAWVVGRHAKRRATETPERVIVSAKSWLCHPGVDRTAAILPWVAGKGDDGDSADGEQAPRISPVAASAAILRQVGMALTHAGHPTLDADVVLTVPASFDQVARQLTLRAAEEAGLSVRLLEEPQAAFYDWLNRASRSDVETLLRKPDGFVIVVIDVGGGTTDLTLLRVRPRANTSAAERLTLPPAETVSVERSAVGRHLLLGGDNIDLTLAHLVERKLNASKPLGPSEFALLVATCQAAKERLLGPNPPSQIPVRLARRGSALFGNVLSAELTGEEVQNVVFDGFLPSDAQNTAPKRKRSGLVAFGLPFESDPAITHHLAAFLNQHHARVDGVLFNGGLFKSDAACRRVVQILETWMGSAVLALPNAAPDEAVARGAVFYGQALSGRGVRFTGGSARGYYVGVDAAEGARKLVCLLPKGTPEDAPVQVDHLPLRLTVGKAVRFDLYENSVERHAPGDIVECDPAAFTRIAHVGARLAAGSGAKGAAPETIPVVLDSSHTAVGTLELACQELEPPQRRFDLVFELRGEMNTAETNAAETREASPAGSLQPKRPSHGVAAASPANASPGGVGAAKEMFHRVFGKGRKDVHPREVKDLWRELERELGQRQTWQVGLLRELGDELLPLSNGRRRTVDHERNYFQLAGYLLRPGFGYPGDAERLATFEPLFDGGLSFATERTSWDQFYIAWRRVAAGMSEAAQEHLRDVCDPFVAPAELKLKRSKAFKTPEIPALWELLSWLERVSPERRAALGQWLLDRTWTSRDPKNWEWLGRVGAREPLYASAHHVVRVRHAEAWLEHLLSEPWDSMPSAPAAALELARNTGDRGRDVSAAMRERVVVRLRRAGVPEAMVDAVNHPVARGDGQRAATYGEDLPPGLSLQPRENG